MTFVLFRVLIFVSMSQPLAKLWVHAILATRNASPVLLPPLDTKLYNYLHECLLELGCPVRIINGMPDHVHMLYLQNPAKSTAEIMKKIKGNTSRWINQDSMTFKKFSWQPGYAAFSVSESQVQKVFDYITNQKEHHLRETFVEEYTHIVTLHGLMMGE